MLGALRTGRGTCWNKVVFLNPEALAVSVQPLPGMSLVRGEVVICRRAGKNARATNVDGMEEV